MIKKNIPNLLTCLNLTCGLLAIMSDHLDLGVFLIIIGGIFDVFDGLVARMLGVSSEIGGELDSLADVVSFGVAPAILFFKAFALHGAWWYLIGPVIVVVAGSVRLARFNVKQSTSSYFEGLAIPASGLALCGLVYGREMLPFLSEYFVLFFLVCIFLAGLNVSTVKMFSFKQFSQTRVKVYFAIIGFAGILSLFFMPMLSLAILLLTYIIIALINSFFIKNALV